MKSLFSQALMNVPRMEDNYLLRPECTQAKLPSSSKPSGGYKLPDGFKALRWDGKPVVYMPSTRKVYAEQLLKLSNIPHPRLHLSQFFSHHHEISKEVLAGHRQTQGTYIDFKDSRLLRQHFHLNEDPVDEIISRKREKRDLCRTDSFPAKEARTTSTIWVLAKMEGCTKEDLTRDRIGDLRMNPR